MRRPGPADERACAYIAGAAPNRWGNFTAAQQQGRRAAEGAVTPPVQLAPGATPEEAARAAELRRSHPLYASIALGELPWGSAAQRARRPCAQQGPAAAPVCYHVAPHLGVSSS